MSFQAFLNALKTLQLQRFLAGVFLSCEVNLRQGETRYISTGRPVKDGWKKRSVTVFVCSLLRGNWAWLAEWTVRWNYPEPGNSGFGCSTKKPILHWKWTRLRKNPHNIISLLFRKHFQTLVAGKQDIPNHFGCRKTAQVLYNFLMAVNLHFHLLFFSSSHFLSCSGLCALYPARQWHVTWHVWETGGKDKNRRRQKGMQWKRE